jgi:hypothetical protein
VKRILAAVAAAVAVNLLSGCGLMAFNWHSDILGGQVQFAGVEDAKSDIHAARAAVACHNHITGGTYRRLGTLVDIDSGVGLDRHTNTFWSMVMCGAGDARASNLGYVVVRRG